MLCQDCRKREAQVHLTQIVNNEKSSLSLCKECASQRGFHSPLENIPFPLAEILAGLTGTTPTPADEQQGETITCPGCGLTFDGFTRQGRFGCGECYRTFRTRIEPIMRKIHGASLHRGHSPHQEAVVATAVGRPARKKKATSGREEGRLETELRKAIEAEDFERAAEIRDKLKSVRAEIKSEA